MSKEYESVPTEIPEDPEALLEDSKTAAEIDPPPASTLWIYILCIANFGLSGSWALEFALTTPYFEKGLQAGTVLSHAVWVVGPLSGLIAAPIVGTMSDRCTSKLGRRRPFIIVGLLATVVGMIVFSHADVIASLFLTQGTDAHRTTAIVIAILAFCVLDLAINTTMWPIRALQGDLIPKSQQQSLQSASIVLGSFGDLAANALVNSFDQPVTHIRLCFYIACAVYVPTVLSLLVVGKEKPMREDDPHLKDAQQQSLNIFNYLRGLPPWMWRVGTTYAFGFFALFCVQPYISGWLGSSVLGGNSEAPKDSASSKLYEKGVSAYGQASLIRAAVQILFSAGYPWLLACGVTAGQLLGIAFGSFSIVTLILAGTKSLLVGKFVVVMLALPLAAHFTLPIGLLMENTDLSHRGRYLGALNCFAVIPQLIDTFYTGFVSDRFGEAAVMGIGAVWGLLTMISALWLMKV